LTTPRVDPPRVRKVGWALLTQDRSDGWFAGLSVTLPYHAEDEARCLRERCPAAGSHHAPHPEGTCGFHGTTDDPLAWMVPEGVLLDVELYGRVIRHERGWRASGQRVLGAQFVRGCIECRQPTEEPVLTAVSAPFDENRLIVVPRCRRCAAVWRSPSNADSISPATLAGLLGTEVSWAPQHVSAAVLRRSSGRRSHWYGRMAG
jgi:hypothetical protein